MFNKHLPKASTWKEQREKGEMFSRKDSIKRQNKQKLVEDKKAKADVEGGSPTIRGGLQDDDFGLLLFLL